MRLSRKRTLLTIPERFVIFSQYSSIYNRHVNLLCGFLNTSVIPFYPNILFHTSYNQFVFAPKIFSLLSKRGWQHFRSSAYTITTIFNATLMNLLCGICKYMQIRGVGYTIILGDLTLGLEVGFSHGFYMMLPVNVQVSTAYPKKKNVFRLYTTSVQYLNEVCEIIHPMRWPDNYQGKGLTYYRQVLRLKPGKKQK